MTTFKHSYTSATEYSVIEIFENGRERKVDPNYPAYIEWINAGNTPEAVSGSEFVMILDGVPVIDPDMDQVLEERDLAAFETEIEDRLRASEWMLHSDSGLTEVQLAEALEYRNTLMCLKSSYATVAEMRENIPDVPFSGVWKTC